MKKFRFAQFAAVLMVSISAGAAFAHEADERAYGEPGNPKKPARIVQVVMKEEKGTMSFIPDKVQVRKGEQIRFKISNKGLLDHEFMLATLADNLAHMKEMEKNPDMEHDDPNGITLKPNANGEIVWLFSKAGTFDFSCLVPGHREAGMHGSITVK